MASMKYIICITVNLLHKSNKNENKDTELEKKMSQILKKCYLCVCSN